MDCEEQLLMQIFSIGLASFALTTSIFVHVKMKKRYNQTLSRVTLMNEICERDMEIIKLKQQLDDERSQRHPNA